MQKTSLKNTLYSKNDISILAKMVSMPLQNHHFRTKNKIAKNISKTNLKTQYNYSMQNKHSKKHLILKKVDPFQYCQKCSQCKAYSLCKIITLGQEIKLPKTYQKRIFRHNRVILCKKTL